MFSINQSTCDYNKKLSFIKSLASEAVQKFQEDFYGKSFRNFDEKYLKGPENF